MLRRQHLRIRSAEQRRSRALLWNPSSRWRHGPGTTTRGVRRQGAQRWAPAQELATAGITRGRIRRGCSVRVAGLRRGRAVGAHRLREALIAVRRLRRIRVEHIVLRRRARIQAALIVLSLRRVADTGRRRLRLHRARAAVAPHLEPAEALFIRAVVAVGRT